MCARVEGKESIVFFFSRTTNSHEQYSSILLDKRVHLIVYSSCTRGTYLFIIAENPPVFPAAGSYVISARTVSLGVSSLSRDAAETFSAEKSCQKHPMDTMEC